MRLADTVIPLLCLLLGVSLSTGAHIHRKFPTPIWGPPKGMFFPRPKFGPMPIPMPYPMGPAYGPGFGGGGGGGLAFLASAALLASGNPAAQALGGLGFLSLI